MLNRLVRLVLGCYCLFWTLRYCYWWRTANRAARHGGSYENPFNDAERICCVYDAPPCPVGVVCVSDPPGHPILFRTSPWVLLRWLFLAVALGLLVDGSSYALLGALAIIGSQLQLARV
jgi:hypothetical protein